MRSLYWKICGTFLVVVLISTLAGATTFHRVWGDLRRESREERMEAARRQGKSLRGTREGREPRPPRQGREAREGRSGRRQRIMATMLLAVADLAARELGEALDDGFDPGRIREKIEHVLEKHPAVTAAYISPERAVHGPPPEEADRLLELIDRQGDVTRVTGQRVLPVPGGLLVLSAVPGGRGHVLLGLEHPPIDPLDSEQVTYDLLQAGLASLGVILIVAVVLGLVVFRALTRQFKRLGDSLTRVAEGDLSSRVASPGGDEIGDLGRSFNAMAERLQRVVEELEQVDANRRQFLADVSHELRTPLTSIRANLEGMQEAVPELAGAPEREIQHLEQGMTLSLEEVEHMGGLVEDLLELARMDSPKFHLVKEESVFQRLVQDAIGRLATSIKNRGVEVTTRFSPEPLRREVDVRRIGQAVTNLLTNAIRSLGEKGHIEVIVEERDARAVIEIADDGRGIPPEDYPRLFERFRTGTRGGTGLGLSIVKRLVDAHGGEVALRPREGGGTVATLIL